MIVNYDSEMSVFVNRTVRTVKGNLMLYPYVCLTLFHFEHKYHKCIICLYSETMCGILLFLCVQHMHVYAPYMLHYLVHILTNFVYFPSYVVHALRIDFAVLWYL